MNAAELALGLVDPERAERALQEDPLLRAEVERLREAAGALAELELAHWRLEPPPPLAGAPVPAAPRRRRRRVFAWAAVAATAAALLIVALRRPPDALEVPLRPLAGTTGRAVIGIHGDRVDLAGAGLPPSRSGTHYEAWLQDAAGHMVSMGSFTVGLDGRVTAEMTIAADATRYRIVDVSLERDDGNPAHSGRSVLRGAITRRTG
jgi:hypothetical protein